MVMSHTSPSPAPPAGGQASLALATVLAVVVGLALIGGMMAMGMMMAGHGGGMMGGMMGGGSDAPQTPVVSGEREVLVEIRDFDYFPRDLTVRAGTTVTWVNRDAAPHTATDEDGEAWDTGRLDKGESASLTFDEPGTYPYFCTFHPYMKATLTVR